MCVHMCMSTGSHPHAASLPLGGAYSILLPPAPLETASLLPDPSLTQERVQQARGRAEV